MKILLMLITAAAISYLLTPWTIKLAVHFNLVDVPNARKIHNGAKPTMGGLAIMASVMLSAAMFLEFSPKHLAILGIGFIFYVIGLLDDIYNLNAKLKFALQVFLAVAFVLLGIHYNFILYNPFGKFSAVIGTELIFIPFSVLWIVGLSNATNIIDGLDGLAAGIVAIACSVLVLSSIVNPIVGFEPLAVVAVGAVIGFLRFNITPARTFMGDNGSLFLGFFVAAVSLTAYTIPERSIMISIMSPALALSIPILDTLFAILRRYRNGLRVFAPDKNHIHHCMLNNGYSHKNTVYIMWFISFLFGMFSIAIAHLIESQKVIALIIMACLFLWSCYQAWNIGVFSRKASKQTLCIGVREAAAAKEYFED